MAWRPVLNVRAVGYRRHIRVGTNAAVFGVIFVGKYDAFLAGARHVLLETNQLAVLGADESLLDGVRRRALHPLPEDVFEIMRVVHERGVSFVADILAHVQEMRVDNVDSLLIDKLLQCTSHFGAPVLADDERIGRHEAPGGVRQRPPLRTHKIDSDNLLAVRAQCIELLAIGRFEQETEQRHVMALGGFAKQVEIADDRAVRERPRKLRDERKDSHQYRP